MTTELNPMPDEIYVVYDERQNQTSFDATTTPDNYMNLCIKYIRADRAEPVNGQDTVAIPRDLFDKIANGLEDIAHLGSPYGKEKRGNSNGNVMAGDLADLLKPYAEQQLEKENG
jgi:hypothetical protein